MSAFFLWFLVSILGFKRRMYCGEYAFAKAQKTINFASRAYFFNMKTNLKMPIAMLCKLK